MLAVVRRRSEPNDPMLPVILEFQWPSTAIINAEAPPLARGIVWIIASLVFTMVLAMAVIPVDQVVSTRGVVVSNRRRFWCSRSKPPLCVSIDVREGQVVKAGQLLARLDPTFTTADLAALSAQVSSSEAEVARLEAEMENKPFTYAGTDPRWIFRSRFTISARRRFEAKLENYQHRLAEAAALILRSDSEFQGLSAAARRRTEY